MAGPLRIEFAGALYHVMARGAAGIAQRASASGARREGGKEEVLQRASRLLGIKEAEQTPYVSAHKLIDIQRFSAREGGAPRRPEIMGLAALAPPEKCRWNVELFMRGYIDGRGRRWRGLGVVAAGAHDGVVAVGKPAADDGGLQPGEPSGDPDEKKAGPETGKIERKADAVRTPRFYENCHNSRIDPGGFHDFTCVSHG